MHLKYLIFLTIVLLIIADYKPEVISYDELYKTKISVQVIEDDKTDVYDIDYGMTIKDFLNKYNLKNNGKLNETYVLCNHDVINLSSNNKKSVNQITPQELAEIPYISSSNARDIIEYRDKYGYFNELEELKNVKGIGESKLKILKEYLCL